MEETFLTRRLELDAFLKSTDELINSKYIIADIKIVGVLKAIAGSETLLALFGNCLTGFDYQEAKRKYLVKSPYLSDDKGEFVIPTSSRELLAFVFNVLMDIDAKRINLGDFLNRYFYDNGSAYAGYSSFINTMIKPFANSVKMLMEAVLDGEVQDPIEAAEQEEERRKNQQILDEETAKKNKELSQKKYWDSLKAVKEILLTNKQKVKNSKLSTEEKMQALLVIDTLANALDSGDKDAIFYAQVAYKYLLKAHKILFFRSKKIDDLVKDVTNEL